MCKSSNQPKILVLAGGHAVIVGQLITKSQMSPASAGVIKRACHTGEDLNYHRLLKIFIIARKIYSSNSPGELSIRSYSKIAVTATDLTGGGDCY